MKRFNILKTIQLTVMLAALVGCVIALLTNRDLFHDVAHHPGLRLLALCLWLLFGLTFFFLYLDFSNMGQYRRDYRELDQAVHSDPLSGLANRNSCDAVIAQYLDKPLPRDLGCVTLVLRNIRDINEHHGHAAGNELIREFSTILNLSSVSLCFVGRNGGNKFMALFENCDESKLSTFLARVQQQIEAHNLSNPDIAIEYRTGRALSRHERVGSITQLISLADRRLTLQMDRVTGLASRASCDDIIAQYLDKPLPESIGCVMLDIANIRDINAAHGHAEGNRAIRQYGDILREAAAGLCFVGRNGGTKFLALFEDCSEEKLAAFLNGVSDRIARYNVQSAVPLHSLYGQAYHEGSAVVSINQLVALSDRRLNEKKASLSANQEQSHVQS